jgi:hypothetical protein
VGELVTGREDRLVPVGGGDDYRVFLSGFAVEMGPAGDFDPVSAHGG